MPLEITMQMSEKSGNTRNLFVLVAVAVISAIFLMMLQNPLKLYSLKPKYHFFSGFAGKPQVQKRPPIKFAVLGTSTPDLKKSQGIPNYDYVLYAPLTSMVWKRIGYQTILLISGSYVNLKYKCKFTLIK